MSLRILFAIRSTLQHQMGGFERVTWDLATRLATRGHEVAFLTTQLPPGVDPQASPLPLHLVGKTRPGTLDVAWWRGSAAWARSHAGAWDAVVSAGHAGQALRGFPFLLFQCHGLRLNERVRLDRHGRLRRRWRGFNRWDVDAVLRELSLLHRADAVVSIGPNPSAALAKVPYRWALGSRPVVQIPNGVDETRFHPDPAAGRAWRASVGIAQDAPVVLTVTRLVDHKGVSQALHAFARWSEGQPEARYVVVGDGPERQRLEEEARRLGVERRTLFTGTVLDGLPAIYQAADAFLFLPTGTEGHPLNVLEALGCGLPVVAPPHAIDATHPAARMFAAPPLDAEAASAALTAALQAPRPGGTACQLPPHLTLDGCVTAYERLLLRGCGPGGERSPAAEGGV